MDSPTDEMHQDIVSISSGTEFFDQVVGHIEDIVLSEEFQQMHVSFLENNWQQFTIGEENKLVCMDIFEGYTNKFENYVMQELQKRMENFDLERFDEELNAYDTTKDPHGFADSEIFELLQTFSDFKQFKELMLDYRSKKEGHFRGLEVDILTTTPLRWA